MKISLRIFLGFVVILAAGFYFLVSGIMKDVNVQPKKSMEEALIDISHILASYLEQEVQEGRISILSLASFMNYAARRKLNARIYELKKKNVTMGVYVTDSKGTVVFDSNQGKLVGRDFSRKNDVYMTLQGRYGARTSRLNPEDPVSSTAYVAAPVFHKGEIVGVCTVTKPWKSINRFLETSRRRIIFAALTLFSAALVISFFLARWITRPIRRLTEYSDSIKEGERTLLPELGKGEIGELGQSFEEMLESLEGKKYIEKYVQTLTHQLKGPLSAIQGAAELLQEEPAQEDRKRFVNNIENESNRLHRIVERMLELAALEQQRKLRNVETFDMVTVVQDIIQQMTLTLKKKEIVLVLKLGKEHLLRGERFLIAQAVYNLLQNAVDFTPTGGTITVEIKVHWGRLVLIIIDDGAGIPRYAMNKVFDKFYSLQRPDNGKKSSGLGLSLVKEVADLHNGDIAISSNPTKGTKAVLKLPKYV